MITLLGHPASSETATLRAVLHWKGLAFEERAPSPWSSAVASSGRRLALPRLGALLQLAPRLLDGETTVTGAQRVLAHLEGEPRSSLPVLAASRRLVPSDPSLRARDRLLSQWVAEVLAPVCEAVRWAIPTNRLRSRALLRPSLPVGAAGDRLLPLAAALLSRRALSRLRDAPSGRLLSADLLNRLVEAIEPLDQALAETGFLCGPAPSTSDFAVYGCLGFLEGLDGWETTRVRRRVAKLIKTLAPEERAGSTLALEVEAAAVDEAMHDARDHRRATSPTLLTLGRKRPSA